MKRYVELLKDFQKWNPEIISQMRATSHHFNSQNLNNWHIEGDVWAHTIMMYRDFLDHLNDNNVNLNISRDVAISILCHDIGKIYNRGVPKGQYGKISFYGHSFSSVQSAIDFIHYLKIERNYDDFNIYPIINAISTHMDYMVESAEENKKLMGNKFTYECGLLKALNYFDKRNAIDNNSLFIEIERDQDILNVAGPTHLNASGCNFTSIVDPMNIDIDIFCGVPGSGKDYVAEYTGCHVISYDDIRVDLFLNSKESEIPDLYEENKAQTYDKAWVWCNKNNIDLNKYLRFVVDKYVKSGEKRIAICNTNLNRKARRSIVNLFKDYDVRIVYVITDSKKLYERNNGRSSKNLDRLVMEKFIYNQQIPNMFEFKSNKNVKDIQIYNNM